MVACVFLILETRFSRVSAKAIPVNIKTDFLAQCFRRNYGNATIVLPSLACGAGFNVLAVVWCNYVGRIF